MPRPEELRETIPPVARETLVARTEPDRKLRSAIRRIALIWLLLCGAAEPSLAACLPATPASGGSVVCSGNDSTGYEIAPGIDNVTVTVSSGTQLDESNPGIGSAIGVNGDSRVVVDLASIIEVTQDAGIGIRGDDSNSVTLLGGILVQSTDGQGISLGGGTGSEIRIGTTGVVQGLSVLANGPLIEFREAPSSGTHLLLNRGQIATTSGRQAVLGSSGGDVLQNSGVIQGDVDLGAGDDRLENAGLMQLGTIQLGNGNDTFVLDGQTAAVVRGVTSDATSLIVSTIDGRIDGGGGTDTFEFGATTTLRVFALDGLTNFETVRVGGGAGWGALDGDNFTGLLEIAPGGYLLVDPRSPLDIAGSFSASPSGTLATFLSPTAAGLVVGGDAALDGKLRVFNSILTEPSASPYPLLSIAGTRTGEFSQTEFVTVSDFKQFEIDYSAAGVGVVVSVTSFADLASSDRDRAVQGYLSALLAAGGTTPELASFLDELNDSNIAGSAANLFGQFSPELYDAQTTVLVESGRQVARFFLDRPRACEPGELDPWTAETQPIPCHPKTWAPWAAPIGSFRKRDGFAGRPEYDALLGGVIAGLDYWPSPPLALSFGVSTQSGRVDVQDSGESRLTLTELTGAAAYSTGPLRIQGLVSWAHGFHEDRREVRIETAAPIVGTAREEHDSDRVTLAAEAGYQFATGPFKVEPLLGLDWSWVFQRPISESGVGGFGLIVESRDDSVGSVNAGLRISSIYHHTRYLADQLEWLDGTWRPEFDLRWRETVSGHERDLSARLRGAPASVADFEIQAKEDRGGFEVGAGLGFVPENANRFKLDLHYDAYIASHTLEHDLTFQLQFGF